MKPPDHSLFVSENEVSKRLELYTSLMTLFTQLLSNVERDPLNQFRALTGVPDLIRKFWKQARSLETLFITKEKDPISQQLYLDITSFYSLLRGMIECYAVFTHLYITPNDIEEMLLRTSLWRRDGLLLRLSFSPPEPDPEIDHQRMIDQAEINELDEAIRKLPAFKKLDSNQQNFILKRSAWKISSISLAREQRKWQHSIKELIDCSGLPSDVLKDLYSYYSSHVHTNYLSILQSDALPEQRKLLIRWMAITNAGIVTAFLIDAYARLAPEVNHTLSHFPIDKKVLITTFLKMVPTTR